jgi:hypothetical protein
MAGTYALGQQFHNQGEIMSAFMQPATHIDALLTAALRLRKNGAPLCWYWPNLDDEARSLTYQAGEPWGPGAIELANDRRRVLTRQSAGRVGAMLLAQNRYSVDFRYAEEEAEEPYLFNELPGKIDPLIVLKALAGYEYQSCETPDWEESEAFTFCLALRLLCINELPGYDAAKGWSIDDRSIFVKAAGRSR